MASVKIAEVAEHLEDCMKRALDDTIKNFAPEAVYNRGSAFRYFVRRLHARCQSSEDVPDNCVESD